MKLMISNLTGVASLSRLVELRVDALAQRHRIDAAAVRVEHRPEASPRFRALVHIAVPGPDLRCECIDHAPARAFSRALDEIAARLQERASRRAARSRHRSLRTAGARLHARR